jgi:phosphate transport system substrate-binding protein
MIHRWLRCLLAIGMGVFCSVASVMAEDLVIPGSGNPEYVLGRLAQEFNTRQSRHRVIVPPSSGTAGALRDVGEGVSTLGRVGRPLKEDERAKGFSFLPIGRDPVVLVAGAGVTVRRISQAQVLDIYSGKSLNWESLGGKAAPIRAIGREPTDASRQALQQVIKPFRDIVFGSNVKVVHLDPQLIELLDRFPTSLGFLNRSALSASKTALVPLALDGIEPTPDNLEKGLYPMWLEFGLVYKANPGMSPAAKAFVEFVRSPEGIRLLRKHGVLPTVTGN